MNTERNAVMSKAKQHPVGGARQARRPGPLAAVLGAACLLAATLGASGTGAELARLTSVSTLTAGRAVTVVIEASEPVPYATAQPDPLTVLVDLRNATAAGVTGAIGRAAGPIADVAVEDIRADDGTATARVRLTLARPGTPMVRSRRNAIFVEFGGAASPRQTTHSPAVPPAAPQPVVLRPQLAAQEGLALTKIDIAGTPSGTRVTLSGSGALPLATAEPTPDEPPRLVIDFKGVLATTQSVAGPANGPVARVRAAQNSRQPLVARVVIDLREPVPFRVENSAGQVVIILEADAQPAPAPPLVSAPVPTPPPTPVVALPTPVAAPKPAVEPPGPVAGAPRPAVETPKPAAETAKLTTGTVMPAAASPGPVASTPKPIAEAPKPVVVEAPMPVQQPAKPAAEPTALVTVPAEPAKVGVPTAQTAAGATQGERVYTGKPVTFDFTGADLRAVLRTFSEPEISGLNVVIDPSITGTVDVSLREVPWDQALEIILRANKLGYVIENNVVRIATLKALSEEQAERRKLAEEQALSGQLRVLTRSLSYAKASDLAELLKKSVMSQRGQVQVDPRTNTIILTDLADALADADDLMTTLDKSEPQVEIEARIVQTTRDSARALGVQWGMNGRMTSELGNTSPLTFPAQGSVSGRTGTTQNNPVGALRNETPTGVNLGVANPTSAIGLQMGTLNGSLSLDVALSALERKGHGKILSTPRVMMQNNVEAEMMQGIQIPIQTVSNNTITVTFKDAALRLLVKPQITASDTVIMDVFLENATPDYSRQVNGIPPI
ncbi:MAG: AMIN domain-containing protein, partial [Vicinamibacterales bacterium]|nr:AMIN domain-containing protein [Vicinamibacterales bacterium]